jgi:hypothetical protein
MRPRGYPKSLGLERLKRDLLRQHRVTDGKVPLRHEAKLGDTFATDVELLDIQAVVKVNAVMRAGVAANDVEEVEQS